MRSNAVQKSFSALVVALLAVTLAFAQDATTPTPQNPPAARGQMGGDPAMRLQHMAQQLNLTDNQKAQIRPILQDEAQQIKALRSDTSLTHPQLRAKVQEIRQATRAKIEPLLTPEQVAKLPKPGTGNRGHGMHGAGGGNGFAMLSSRLNLTEDQKAKIQPLMAAQQQQVQAVKQDTTLTPEQKQAKIKELRKSTHQQVMSILTPEQQQQMKNMRDMRQRRNAPPQQQTPTPPL